MQPAGGLIVDDHTFMRQAMTDCLAELGVTPVREANCVSDGYVLAAEATPQLAVLDLRLEDGTSLGLLTALHQAGARVLVLSSADDGYSVRSAYAAGAAGYLLKSSPRETVLRGMREVLAGRAFADPSIARLLSPAEAGAPEEDPAPLTEREVEVLQLVASGLTNAEIAQGMSIAPLSVKGHLARISRKLGEDDRSRLVDAALRADLLS